MMKQYTFDTNILSYYLKGNEGIRDRLNKELLEGNQFIINPITYYEISRGLIEDADLFIAAVCIVNDLQLITNNKKHFSRIHGLKTENWLEQ